MEVFTNSVSVTFITFGFLSIISIVHVRHFLLAIGSVRQRMINITSYSFRLQKNIMTTQIRDTQFGHLIRYISGNASLQYPDEVDPSLYMKPARSTSKRLQNNTGDPLNTLGNSSEIENGELNKERDGVENTEIKDDDKAVKMRAGSDAETAFLVDWYNPDDPEVSALVLTYLSP